MSDTSATEVESSGAERHASGTSTAPGTGRSGPRWRNGGLVALALVPVAVLLVPAQIVVMDGGLHLSSAASLRGLIEGRWPALLEWRLVLPPNLSVEALIAVGAGVVDPNALLRLVLLAAVAGFAVAAACLVRAAGAPAWSAVFLLPLSMNAALMIGLLGFAVAVVPSMFAIALALRRPDGPPIVAISVLLTLTWLTHLIPALAATVAIVCVVLCRELSVERTGGRRVLRSVLATGRSLAVPIGLVVVLTLAFLLLGGTDGSGVSRVPGGGPRVLDLTKPMVTLASGEYWLVRVYAIALYAGVGLLVALRLGGRWSAGSWRVEPADGLLLAGLTLGAVSVVAPEGIGSVTYTATRLSVYFPLLLGAWVATQVWRTLTRQEGRFTVGTVQRRVLGGTTVVVAIVTLALPLVRLGPLMASGDDLREMRSLAACAPAGTTIVQLHLDWGDRNAERVLPMVDQVGHLAVDRDLLDLGNISGTASYYVWTFTDVAQPVPTLSPEMNALQGAPPEATIGAALAAGYPLDQVLVYGRRDATDRTLADARWAAVEADLVSSFRRVAVSSPSGVSELWVRRGLASPCG